MKTKVCTKCGRELPLGEFSRSGYRRKDGTRSQRSWCKRCVGEYNASYSASPKGRTATAKYQASSKGKAAAAKHAASKKGKATKAKWRAENSDKCEASYAKWLAKNPDYFKEYPVANREKIKKQRAAWYQCNKERERVRGAEYRATPKGRVNAVARRGSGQSRRAAAKYQAANPEKIRVRKAIYLATPQGKATARAYNVKYYAEHLEESRVRLAKYRSTPKGKAADKRQKFKRRSRFNIDPKLTADDWQKILELYDYRCAYCGAPWGEKHFRDHDHIIPVSRDGKHEAANVVPACEECNRIIKRAKLPHELPLHMQEVIKRHAELLGEANIPIIEQERLYAAF